MLGSVLTNVLIPPGKPAPTGAGKAFAVAGGWLLACPDAPLEQIRAWRYDEGFEVWQSRGADCGLTAHLFDCRDFSSLQEVCINLALENMGITDVAVAEASIRLSLRGAADARGLTRRLRPLAVRLDMDIAITGPETPRLNRPGLLFMDMDSTLIRCECIDEIAAFLGIKDKIAAITQRAMEGELDFADSLRERVSLLAGLDACVLDTVYAERIALNDGAERLLAELQKHGWKTGLVSGGFTYFTQKLQQRLGLDFVLSNTLEIKDGRLTGNVVGAIVDADAKRAALIRQAKAWGIPMSQTVALGDGANDLPMLEAAALGIAFHAKPRVRELAPYAISRGGLDRTLDLL